MKKSSMRVDVAVRLLLEEIARLTPEQARAMLNGVAEVVTAASQLKSEDPMTNDVSALKDAREGRA